MAAVPTGFTKIIKQAPMGLYKQVEAECDGPGSAADTYDPTTHHIITAQSLGLGRIHGFTLTNAVLKTTGVPTRALFAYPGPASSANSGGQGFGSIVVYWTTAPLSITEAGLIRLDTDQFRLLAWGDNL